MLKSGNDLLNHILDNHRHMNFFVTYVASEKIVFQHLIAVSKTTKKVMVLKENVIVDTKKGDASAYYSSIFGEEFTRGADVVHLTLDTHKQESDNIFHMRRVKFFLVNDKQNERDEKIRLASSKGLLEVSKSCMVTRRHFFSYREHKGKVQDKLNESVKAIGLVMQFTHYDTSVLTPIVALDENDTRENKDRKSTRLNSSHSAKSRMPSSA